MDVSLLPNPFLLSTLQSKHFVITKNTFSPNGSLPIIFDSALISNNDSRNLTNNLTKRLVKSQGALMKAQPLFKKKIFFILLI